MDTKKNEARFTIKFNPANLRHREAMRILNEAGRGKAALIADALCMYIHYGADSFMLPHNKPAPISAPAIQSTRATTNKDEDDDLLSTLADSTDMFFD